MVCYYLYQAKTGRHQAQNCLKLAPIHRLGYLTRRLSGRNLHKLYTVLIISTKSGQVVRAPRKNLFILHLWNGKKHRSLKLRFWQCILYFPPVLYSNCQSGHRTKLLFSHADTPKKHVLCYETVFSNLQVLMSQGFRAKLPTGLHIGSAPWTMAQPV